MDSDLEPVSKLISLICLEDPNYDSDWDWDMASKMLLMTIQIISLINSIDLESQPQEPKLMALVSQAVSVFKSLDLESQQESLLEVISITKRTMYLFKSLDLESQQESLLEVISITKRTMYLFKSLDLYSEPKPLSKLKSLIIQDSPLLNSVDSDWEFIFYDNGTLHLRSNPNATLNFFQLVYKTWSLEPEPELMSLVHRICFFLMPMNSKWKTLVSLCPQVRVVFEEGEFRVTEKDDNGHKWYCLPALWKRFSPKGESATHFYCRGCNGKNHQEYEKAPLEIKHPLHPKHSLHLVLLEDNFESIKCYCCDEDLTEVLYYCSACSFAINITCVEKQRVLSIDHPKWHEHTLALFSRTTSLTCDLCGLADSTCAFYLCSPCGFVAHQRCLSLPHVLRISRHPHRIAFTPSFLQGDWSCGVCRRKIYNDYGGYSCIKEGCSYVVHSKCATQSNVWDGKDFEGEPEAEEEVLEPFVRISDGIIQHFSHQHHHLRLDEYTKRDYDEDKMCQACVTPIYFGNFYSCMHCDDYILHETCANHPRKIHHPIHPHLLTLVGGYDGVVTHYADRCSACQWTCKTGFFYECGEEECDFKLDVQCATISEPLVHGSHTHPLFLTSKPREQRECGVCKDTPWLYSSNETFNCVKECDFALCFKCATLPQKVRYKYDKYILTLSYCKEAMMYWCEA